MIPHIASALHLGVWLVIGICARNPPPNSTSLSLLVIEIGDWLSGDTGSDEQIASVKKLLDALKIETELEPTEAQLSKMTIRYRIAFEKIRQAP